MSFIVVDAAVLKRHLCARAKNVDSAPLHIQAKCEYPNGALGWLHAASTHPGPCCVLVDVAVLEVDSAFVDVDTTALPNKSKRENPIGALGWLHVQ